MKIAVSEHQNNVAATCDFANNVVVFTFDNDRIINRERLELNDHFIPLRCAKLRDHGVDILICGAISAPFVIMLQHRGIEVINGITGTVETVIQEFLKGDINSPQYLLPGFAGKGCTQMQRRKNRRGCRGNRKN